MKENIDFAEAWELAQQCRKTRPDPDETIPWTCPECGRTNTETHFCRAVWCECGEFRLPPIPLPVKGGPDTSLKAAIAHDRLTHIDEDIRDSKYELRRLKDKIDEVEEWIRELEKERKDLITSFGGKE